MIGGGEDAYDEAFKITADEFDTEFEKYLKDRFKPFRDKERPADYGRNLMPNPEKTPFRGACRKAEMGTFLISIPHFNVMNDCDWARLKDAACL